MNYSTVHTVGLGAEFCTSQSANRTTEESTNRIDNKMTKE